MQMMIEIDEDIFTRLFDNGVEDYAIINDDLFAIAKSIRNGTPLPKGHGRLIDADAIYWFKGEDENGNPCYILDKRDLSLEPTILEADKESDANEKG